MIKLNYTYSNIDEFLKKYIELLMMSLNKNLSNKEIEVLSKLFLYMKLNKLKRIDKFTRKFVADNLKLSAQNVNNIINSLKLKELINEYLELHNSLELTSNKIDFQLSVEFKNEKPNS